MQILVMRTLIRAGIVASVAFVGSVANPGAAGAATYYVATTGSDTNPCTQAAPCATVARAGSQMVPGDTVYLRGGTYTTPIRETSLPSGTSSGPITVAAFPGEMVTIKPTGGARCITLETGNSIGYLVFDRLICDGINSVGGANAEGVLVERTHAHIRFTNWEVKNTGISGFLIAGSYIEVVNTSIHDGGLAGPNGYAYCVYNVGNNNIFDRIQCHHYTGYGFHIYNSIAPYPSNNTVSNSVIYHNGSAAQPWAAGILLAKGDGNAAYNNVVYANGHGIMVEYGATNSKVYNNTVYANTYYGMDIGDNSGASNTSVMNNIIHQNGSGNVLNAGTGTTFSNNLCNAAGTGCSVVGDPKFVSASTGDFHLQSSSAAIDRGVTVATLVSDLDNVSRPQGAAYDIGSFEYPTGPAAPAAPTNVRIVR
jgi:parallel beta-helix repeat protein